MNYLKKYLSASFLMIAALFFAASSRPALAQSVPPLGAAQSFAAPGWHNTNRYGLGRDLRQCGSQPRKCGDWISAGCSTEWPNIHGRGISRWPGPDQCPHCLQ